MQRPGLTNRPGAGLSLGDLLTARPTGLTEVEAWAILCQAVQALQDLFLSDGASGGLCVPLVTPSTILLSSRGRVKLHQSSELLGCGIPAHLTGYLAPEYRANKQYSDTETEKMWIYGLGETLKRATLTSHAATSRLSGELCQVLTDMTRPQPLARANLMHLLDVISEYCKRRQQNRPFSHIVMDLHQETMAELELSLETPWTLPPIPGEIKSRPLNRYDPINKDLFPPTALSNHWMAFDKNKPKLTREASTSMEDLSIDSNALLTPGAILRPKSMCIPLGSNFFQETNNEKVVSCLSRSNNFERPLNTRKKSKTRRNPVQRAASRLYRASAAPTILPLTARDCVGPEFVVRASFPNKQLTMQDCKGHTRKTVTVIMLNGQKLDVICNPNTTTAGQLFELIIQKEHIEENFMLGLSALIAGDFVFLPTDARICKAVTQGNAQGVIALTLFVRVRFFLPSLRGIRSTQARHLLYLQLRRAVLEYQLPCNYSQLIEFGGLALQAEFGDFNETEHGIQDYFLLDHYVPETLTCNSEENKHLKQDLIRAHISRSGLDIERAEEDFISVAQSLPHYGGHFYTAIWTLKDNTQKDVWLYISAQGINLYERTSTSHQRYPVLLEMFEWRTIQTLCYSKHYLCILPHSSKMHQLKLKKYKLKMNHKKSYFTFRLASLHHQFFLRLRTQYTSLHSLSEQFGIQLKDMKNETNSLYKLEALTNPLHMALDSATVNAETEFKIEFCFSTRSSMQQNQQLQENKCRRSKSVSDFAVISNDCVNEELQNKENENPQSSRSGGLILDSRCLSGLPNSVVWDKRRGVKMGVRAFTNNGRRISRSMEAVNTLITEDVEEASLQSTSLNCSSTSISKSPVADDNKAGDAYILDSTIKCCTGPFLPDFQETLSQSFLDKLNKFSFAEERILQTVLIDRNSKGSLGLQIMEGSDGKVYIQSVIPGGPAFLHGSINVGDQIVAVNGQNLLSVRYLDALDILKSSGKQVEFVISQISTSKALMHSQATLPSNDKLLYKLDLSGLNESHLKKLKRMSYPNYLSYSTNSKSPIEKHVTESCHDITNVQKLNSIPYHKHIRYNLESKATPKLNLTKHISQSCTALPSSNNNRAVIVDMIPKLNIPHIPLPRSLGLSRKWRGPVRYPVTPIKKFAELNDDSSNYVTTSDEEQIFI